jgi:acetyl-CoA acetyltransferase
LNAILIFSAPVLVHIDGNSELKKTVISGVGRSAVGRKLGRSGLSLTIDAIKDALTDSGLQLTDIDGLSTWPGYVAAMKGMAPVGISQVKEALRMKLDWFSGGGETAGQMGAFVNACAAVEAGLARHVIVFRTITESTVQAAERANPPKAEAPRPIPASMQWQMPFYAMSPTNWMALYAAAHFDTYGTTREQLAQIALNGRRNAQLNPQALMRDPLTMEDYLGSRMISTPLCLLDCDMATDGSVAIIVSRRDASTSLRHARPITVEALGCAMHGRDSWDQFTDLASIQSHDDSARQMWSRTDLKPADVDFGAIYDGFSFLTMAWLESLGFCGRGEGGAFIEGGHAISREGSIPINTDGGQLSGARLHGYGFLYESCKQLWGEAGERQLTRSHEVAVAAIGGGAQAACALLTH